MGTDTPVLYPVATIGAWTQSGVTVSEFAQYPEIWEPPCFEMSREELTAAVAWNGGIADEYALEATTRRDGSVELVNGVHRWAVANELGYPVVPVVMTYEPAEDEAVPGAEFAY
jgi:hypothetical protein